MTSHFAIKRNAIALLLAYLTQSVIFADTVRLKDGRIITNVKSKIEGKQILLESPDGTTRSFPMDMLKTIEPGPVLSRKPKIKIKSSEPKKSESKETIPVPNPFKIPETPPVTSPVDIIETQPPLPPTVAKPERNLSWLWAPAPVWSGLIASDRRNLGIGLTIGKSISFLLAAAYRRSPHSTLSSGENITLLYLADKYLQSNNDKAFSLVLSRYENLSTHVYTPFGNNIIDHDEYEKRKRSTVNLFVLLVLADGIFTYLNGPSSNSAALSRYSRLSVAPTYETTPVGLSSGFRTEWSLRF
ncbi:hypothetical protein LEP1GSC047_0620 [Leptospira inadai serovar Lyme str. 10]|uniref:Uncharacterized protein n=2 Tax=Leptospira inadai serovar Lyme TaxID=293084 RepID=V6HQ03_9LEPT|nr:hypothetical protein [Leptospira inadai]EQA38855.1 hypothetical protein LEP1GSC047_0620 [Leptospira inadai serovar Lyme str. 10]PNV72277.1 hypothetical protein BES34_019685 [Leptospira inadai serovar Lyme]